MPARIRKGDRVVAISGKDRGKSGVVLEVRPDEQRVVVEGVNIMKRHTKAGSRNQSGGIVQREAPIHVSNVMPWCEAEGKPSRILMKRLEDGRRIRVWKLTGETLD